MKKAITGAFCIAYPSYLVIALLGFAAFGVSVQSELLLSLTLRLSKAAMYVVWVFVIIKTATEGAIYNQSAFYICGRILGISKRMYDVLFRIIWVVVSTLVALYIPFFGDLTAITGALSVTPLTYIYPCLFWNIKHEGEAPKWRIRFHYVFIAVWVTLGVLALVGAIWSLINKLGNE
jgi:vesicular inhibitory amino acid transporter